VHAVAGGPEKGTGRRGSCLPASGSVREARDDCTNNSARVEVTVKVNGYAGKHQCVSRMQRSTMHTVSSAVGCKQQEILKAAST
jgi:uncharacterized protein GlcG (DUF336 family)